MAETLSPADRAALAAEVGPVSMAVGGVMVFQGGRGLTRDVVAERLSGRLHLIPRYRQRLEQPPLGLAHPVWVDDVDFDLDRHVRAATLPAPGGAEALAGFVADLMGRRLERDAPLWELWVVDGLTGGRVALVPKMHHALVDGVAAVDVGTVVLDPTPEPLEIPEPEGGWTPREYDRARHYARIAATPFLSTQKFALETARRALDVSARSATTQAKAATDLVAELAKTRPQAPMTPLNRPIGERRAYAMARAPLEAVKAAGKSRGGTVNDAILAAVTGMLRRYLEEAAAGGASASLEESEAPDEAGSGRRSALDRRPVALVPVSLRRDGDRDGALGNRISMVFVDLPVEEATVDGRVRAIGEQMRALRDSAAVRAGALFASATGWAPPAISGVLARAMAGRRACNLVVSNIPGPQQPFYLAGARLLEIYPVIPLNPATIGLTVGVLSYDGHVFFGLLADAALDPPLATAAAALRASLEELA